MREVKFDLEQECVCDCFCGVNPLAQIEYRVLPVVIGDLPKIVPGQAEKVCVVRKD